MTGAEFGETDLVARLDEAFQSGGVMEALAWAALERPVELTPDEIADVILPPKDPEGSLAPRWQLAENAKVGVREAANERSDQIIDLARQLGMRLPTILSEVGRVDPATAIWLVEGGANRTSVIRRQLAVDAMKLVHGDYAEGMRLYQFGSDRLIPREYGSVPNPEYKIAQEITGDNLPSDSLTEHGLNFASALQGGYELTNDDDIYNSAAQQVIRLQKEGSPDLVLIMPNRTQKGGLEDGFSAIDGLIGSAQSRQFVIATNGQYRPKDEAQADQWARTRDIYMLPAVAIGDETGYKVLHAGQEFVTGERLPMIYVHEFVVLHRLLKT